jgi:hypothetical protein
MMPTLPLWAWKLIAGALLIAATVGVTWLAADVHYTKQYTALKASLQQEARDQAAEDAATLTRYAIASQEINNDAQKQIAGMSNDIADLRVRNDGSTTALQLCTNDQVRDPVPVADGSRVGTSSGSNATAAGSSEPAVAVPLGEYKDQLNIAIKAIDAELAMRRIFRDGGQAPPQ